MGGLHPIFEKAYIISIAFTNAVTTNAREREEYSGRRNHIPAIKASDKKK